MSMMENYLHIEEEIIKQLAFVSDSMSEHERKGILNHLNECELCNEVYKKYNFVFNDIASEFDSEPTEHDKEIAKKLSAYLTEEKKKLLLGNKSFVQIYEGNFEIVNQRRKLGFRNFVNIIIYNPVKSAASIVFAGILFTFLMMYLPVTTKDLNPSFVEVENRKLKVYNIKSELLWEKTSFGLPENITYEFLMNWTLDSKKFVNIEDINGDNINEVLISGRSFSTYEGYYKPDSVYCYDNKGNLNWVSGCEMPNNLKAPKWRNTGRFIRDFFTTKTDKQKKLFIIGNDRSYAGAFISEINPNNGEVVSTLYHSGWFTGRVNVDLENDGVEEIILAGTSSFDKPSILVLKTDKIHGVMPDFYSKDKNFEKGSAYAYILIYVRDLGKFNKDFAFEIEMDLKKLDKDGFYVNTPEVSYFSNKKEYSGIMYAFNNNLEVNSISSSTKYSEKYNQLFKDGLVKEKLDSTYFQMLKDSVQYWDGDGFVKYPVENKYYYQKKKK